ncbi:hypothetical protein C6P41_001435 [Kluyveromyces marxianus]|nr:hypothetical protein C6P41_001435 [Kluyveromyces marxianus]
MEPVFSNRVSIQWGDEAPKEDTSTWILTAPDGKFVDARISLESNVPQWLITGKEVEIPTKEGYEFSIQFVHELDSVHGQNSEHSADTGHFKTLADKSRLEEGEMYNVDRKQVMKYKEVWRSIDSLHSTPEHLVATSVSNGLKASEIQSFIWELPEDSKGNARGRLIKIGRFSQGIVEYNKSYQCIRIFDNSVVYQYGSNLEEIFGQFMRGLSTRNVQFPWKRVYP